MEAGNLSALRLSLCCGGLDHELARRFDGGHVALRLGGWKQPTVCALPNFAPSGITEDFWSTGYRSHGVAAHVGDKGMVYPAPLRDRPVAPPSPLVVT